MSTNPTDEDMFVLPMASASGLFINWDQHENGTHIYGYQIHDGGGFQPDQNIAAGYGVYLSMCPFPDHEKPQTKHAFVPPKKPLMVLNEPAYLQTHPELMLKPVAARDTIWLKLCKHVAQTSRRASEGGWDDQDMADTLTKVLWSAGYDSIYFCSPAIHWIVLLIPGRPFDAHCANRQNAEPTLSQSHYQPIILEIDAFFEVTTTMAATDKSDTRNWLDFFEGQQMMSELEREIHFTEARLKCHFSQDWLDTHREPFCEIALIPTASKVELVPHNNSGLLCVRTIACWDSKTLPIHLHDLHSIILTESTLTIAGKEHNPHSFENRDYDNSASEKWFWYGSPLPNFPLVMWDHPSGLKSSEWFKLIREKSYIARHTTHPLASSMSLSGASFAPSCDDLVDWVLMLPTIHLQNLGLIPETLRWFDEERSIRSIP
jgi:hypothetical protein